MGKTKNGSCLCGKVTISIHPEKEVFDACHCGMCRKWGGGPNLTVSGGEKISMTGEEFIQLYSSSDWAERGFCKNCGTHLFYHLKNTHFYNFGVGLFKDMDNFKFETEIYIDSKPSNYEFANSTEKMTEAQVIAMFSSSMP